MSFDLPIEVVFVSHRGAGNCPALNGGFGRRLCGEVYVREASLHSDRVEGVVSDG